MVQFTKIQPRDNGKLQAKDGRDLLDIIDRLRSHGISRFVDLPQIVVCGDQSSGKSSVLEAISGVAFPAKDTLCTRFATELILRRAPEANAHVSILPDSSRSQEERTRLESFTNAPDNFDFSQVVNDANIAMGLNQNSKVFSSDVLRVEISGPSQPHLTMVDLPGLFLAGNKDQTTKDARLVKSLVLDYMKSPRSIILAVVSAKSDFALQQITQHSRHLDPDGTRTLGLITKPDTLDEGSDSERFYIELARNNDLPHVVDDVENGIKDCRNRLKRLGESRITSAEQRRYLLKLTGGFTNLVKAAIDGLYIDAFFSGANGPKIHERRLRAVVQNKLVEFADEMRTQGHAKIIIEALRYVTNEATSSAILREIIAPSMEKLQKNLASKMEEILDPHLSGHPITYNHYLTESLQKIQAQRHRQRLEKQVDAFFETSTSISMSQSSFSSQKAALLDRLVATEPDMDSYSASIATDTMRAYYKVALKKVIDDVSVLAIERCLIQKLPELLAAEVIYELSDEETQRIAGESDESAAERSQALEKLSALESALTELKHLKKYQPSTKTRGMKGVV
ncbi:putative interferon-induced gtp-binding protein mx protein [Eutypa lata UCREL1]|uniref:Putative interferon-induced gtp-binding protein mx protein n=1 Tax=Eutypa lata (strain UCR-EL1) TaxID=1287681 RepID=M7SDA9_EUTLA|nr:putative interferon-induced gtp-binding protein mx protein [Eutypa lata UCREL1]